MMTIRPRWKTARIARCRYTWLASDRHGPTARDRVCATLPVHRRRLRRACPTHRRQIAKRRDCPRGRKPRPHSHTSRHPGSVEGIPRVRKRGMPHVSIDAQTAYTMKSARTHRHLPPVHAAHTARGDGPAPAGPHASRAPRARPRDVPHRANAPMGVARTNRASSSAPGEALSKALNYRRYDFAGERAVRLEAQQQQQRHELRRASGMNSGAQAAAAFRSDASTWPKTTSWPNATATDAHWHS